MPPYRFVQGKVARHIAVDLDGTLAHHDHWKGVEHIGEPIKPMVDRVKKWVGEGHKVTVFTARSHDPKTRDLAEKTVQDWTEKHIGKRLPVTHEKSPNMDEFWDDRATHVERNTGKVAEQQGRCLREARALVERNPAFKLMMGPPGKPGDTTHFWAVDPTGKVHDPASDRVESGYAYQGKEVDPSRTTKTAGSLEFYHYVDPAKWESVQKHGLLSLRGLREAGLTEDYQAALAKYKDRVPPDQDVENWLHNLRGEGWDDYLYAFRQPIPVDAAQPFRDYAAAHKLVKFRVPTSTALYDYKAGVHPDFSRPPEGDLLFQNIPHVGVQIGRSVPAEEVLPVKAAIWEGGKTSGIAMIPEALSKEDLQKTWALPGALLGAGLGLGLDTTLIAMDPASAAAHPGGVLQGLVVPTVAGALIGGRVKRSCFVPGEVKEAGIGRSLGALGLAAGLTAGGYAFRPMPPLPMYQSPPNTFIARNLSHRPSHELNPPYLGNVSFPEVKPPPPQWADNIYGSRRFANRPFIRSAEISDILYRPTSQSTVKAEPQPSYTREEFNRAKSFFHSRGQGLIAAPSADPELDSSAHMPGLNLTRSTLTPETLAHEATHALAPQGFSASDPRITKTLDELEGRYRGLRTIRYQNEVAPMVTETAMRMRHWRNIHPSLTELEAAEKYRDILKHRYPDTAERRPYRDPQDIKTRNEQIRQIETGQQHPAWVYQYMQKYGPQVQATGASVVPDLKAIEDWGKNLTRNPTELHRRFEDWQRAQTTLEQMQPKKSAFELPKKEHYRSADPSDVKSFFTPGQVGSAKIDGAAVILHASPAGLETYSIRPSVTGDPIEHTERLGVKPPVDPKHQGLMLRGELYGVRKDTGKAIPAHELGGILNAGVPNSLAKQKAQNVSLRVAVFDVHAPDKPYADRLDLVKDVLAGLPADKFHLPPMATDPKAMAKMWDEISGGKHPLTQEGMVFTPLQDGKPTKVKLRPEADVTIRKVFPGEGKLEGKGAGGFEYSVDDSGQVVGRVGTGFSQAVREDMLSHPEQWIDRIARIRSQGQFESGAHRAPSFIARHEG